MTQAQIMQQTFDQMENVFTSYEFKSTFMANGGHEKLTKHKTLQFCKRMAVQQDPDTKRCKTWIKKTATDVIKNVTHEISERDVIAYLKDNDAAEDLCVRFLKHRGYRILKNVEVEL